MPLTAESIGEFVAPFIGLAWPNDELKVFQILSLVQSKIWQSGKFHNSMKYFYVNTRSDKTIITPHGYNVLLGCNVNFKPVNINGPHAMFHRNGPAEMPMTGRDFNTSIQYLGESPVIFQPNESWCDPCKSCSCNCIRNYFITVCGKSCPQKAITVVSALGCSGNPIYTYYKEETGETPVVCEGIDIVPEEVRYIEGVKYPILGQPVFHKNIIVTNIYNITKEPSVVPVEYFLTDACGVGTLIARMEPYETVSKYKRYQVAGNCIRGKCILGLFKRSKPVDIVDGAQIFISDNKEAILAMAQGMNYVHIKEDIQTGNNFIAQALMSLREELREESPNTTDRLQIESIRDFSKIKEFA